MARDSSALRVASFCASGCWPPRNAGASSRGSARRARARMVEVRWWSMEMLLAGATVRSGARSCNRAWLLALGTWCSARPEQRPVDERARHRAVRPPAPIEVHAGHAGALVLEVAIEREC